MGHPPLICYMCGLPRNKMTSQAVERHTVIQFNLINQKEEPVQVEKVVGHICLKCDSKRRVPSGTPGQGWKNQWNNFKRKIKEQYRIAKAQAGR